MKKNALYLTGFVFSALLFSCSTSNVTRLSTSEMEVATSSPRNVKPKNDFDVSNEVKKSKENISQIIFVENENYLNNNEEKSIPTIKKNKIIATSIISEENNTVVTEVPVLVANASKTTLTKSELKNDFKNKKITLVERVKIRFIEKMKRMLPNGGKSQLVAFLLAFFLGYLGIHRFYLGYIGIGIIQLLTGGFCIWAFIDWIRILTGGLKPKNGEYGTTIGNK